MGSILVVDDTVDFAEALADLLRSKGHDVRVASNGVEGLRFLRASALPDLIVLDIEMPILSGPEMIRQMLVHGAGEETIPILLLSARVDLSQVAKQVGTPYFLLKPGNAKAFLRLVNRALRKRPPVA